MTRQTARKSIQHKLRSGDAARHITNMAPAASCPESPMRSFMTSRKRPLYGTHLCTRAVQMFAHANVCTKNSPGQRRTMAKCYIMRCAMRSVGEVQRSPNAPHPVWRGGLSKGAIRCISPFHGFHHLASITFHIQAQGLVCVLVPIGTPL